VKFVGRGHFPLSGEKTLQLGRAGRDPVVRRQRPISQYLNLRRGTRGLSKHIDFGGGFPDFEKTAATRSRFDLVGLTQFETTAIAVSPCRECSNCAPDKLKGTL
jgi:hypothetical protein